MKGPKYFFDVATEKNRIAANKASQESLRRKSVGIAFFNRDKRLDCNLCRQRNFTKRNAFSFAIFFQNLSGDLHRMLSSLTLLDDFE